MTNPGPPSSATPSGLSVPDQSPLTRLLRGLRRNRGSALYFARCNTHALRAALIETVQQKLGEPVAVVHITDDLDLLVDVQIRRVLADDPAPVVFVLDLEKRLSQPYKADQYFVFQEINMRRGPICLVERSLIFCLPDFALNILARETPDFFDWRSGLYEFESIEALRSDC